MAHSCFKRCKFMQIIPESEMSFQSWFKGKRYLTKYTQQGKIVKNGSLQTGQWPRKLVERLKCLWLRLSLDKLPPIKIYCKICRSRFIIHLNLIILSKKEKIKFTFKLRQKCLIKPLNKRFKMYVFDALKPHFMKGRFLFNLKVAALPISM